LLRRLPLPRLTSQEATDLLDRLGGNTNMADYLYSQSGGNPYYLTQLSDVVVDGIPATLAELVRARLSYLPEHLLPTLQAAAILEPAIDLEILCQTSQRSEEETLDALDGLLAVAVLVEAANSYEFAHPLVATVVRDGLGSGRRRLLHRRAALSLATHYADQLSTVAGQLARHYAEAGEALDAARFAEMAGDEAMRIGAAAEAVAFYQQAIALAPTPGRQLALGHAYLLLPGKMAEARSAMQQALATYEAEGNCQGTVKAGLRLAASYLATQEGAQVLYWAQRVLPDLETVEDVTLHASAHYLMGTAKFRNGYGQEEAAAHYAEATRLVTEHQLESEIALMSWFEWGNLCLEQGNYPLAVEKFQTARKVAQASQSLFFEVLCCNNLAYALLLQGDRASASEMIETGLVLGQTYALFPAQQYLYSTQGEILLASGQLAAAEQAFQQALVLAEKYDNPSFAANVRAHLGRVAQSHGALDVAEQLLSTAQAALQGETARYLQTQINLWLAEVQLQRGEQLAAAQNLGHAEASLLNLQNPGLRRMARYLRSQLS
jgi:tetratricopeptide (TPR) repeat protein